MSFTKHFFSVTAQSYKISRIFFNNRRHINGFHYIYPLSYIVYHSSVETVFTLLSAPCIACHERLAHLTLEGNCQMPEKTVSFSKSFGSRSGFNSPMTSLWN